MRKIQMLVDIVMFCLFLLLMGYHITGNFIHEILGVFVFALFILHHILNRRWYQALPKGKYSLQRKISTVVDFLLLLAMFGMMVSAILISSRVFAFLNLPTTTFGRNLHLASTAWGFVLMAIHLGLHLRIFFDKLQRKVKETSLEYVFYFVILLLFFYSIYAFLKNALWKDMFLVSAFKYFNYDQSPIFFYFEYLGIVIFFVFLTYFIGKLWKKATKRKL